jgi:hypothetical protein
MNGIATILKDSFQSKREAIKYAKDLYSSYFAPYEACVWDNHLNKAVWGYDATDKLLSTKSESLTREVFLKLTVPGEGIEKMSDEEIIDIAVEVRAVDGDLNVCELRDLLLRIAKIRRLKQISSTVFENRLGTSYLSTSLGFIVKTVENEQKYKYSLYEL